MFLHIYVLVTDDSDRPALLGLVVVIGRELRQIRSHRRLTDPPIEKDEVWMILLHDLSRSGYPVLRIGRANIGPVLRKFASTILAPILYLHLGGSVEVCVFGIVNVRRHVPSAVHEP